MNVIKIIVTAFAGFLTTSNPTVDLKLKLFNQPSSNITIIAYSNNPEIEFSQDTFVFTSSNYEDVQDLIVTYRPDNNNIKTEEKIQIVFSYSGAATGTQTLNLIGISPKNNPLALDRPVFSDTFYRYNIYNDISVNSYESISTKRHSLKANIWKNGQFPSFQDTVNQIEENFTGVTEFTTLDSFQSMRRVRVDMDGGEFYDYGYIIEPTSISQPKLIWVNYGHGSAFDINDTDHMIESFLKKGYVVCVKHLSLNGLNNTTRNPPLTTVDVAGHNLLDLIENDTLNPVKYFIESQIRITNQALKLYPQLDSTYYMIGISGGGWSTAITAAVDTRILKSFSVAGIQPIWANSLTNPSTTDWEQGYEYESESEWHNYLRDSCSYMDVFLLASQDREHYHFRNTTDPCCFSGYDWKAWSPKIQALSKHWANGKFKVFEYKAPTHKYDTEKMLLNLLELID